MTTGGQSEAKSTPAKELSCEQLPPEADCPAAPPKPVPMSPGGPVRVFKSEYSDSGSTDSEDGLFEVAATAPGTFAETGIVYDTRAGHDAPLVGASVTYSSIEGPGLSAPPGGAARVTTRTGYGGAYAFIDMPVARGGTCYRLVVMAPGIGRYESIDVIDPGVYDNSGLELDGGSDRESYLTPTRGKQMPQLNRACLAQAAR